MIHCIPDPGLLERITVRRAELDELTVAERVLARMGSWGVTRRAVSWTMPAITKIPAPVRRKRGIHVVIHLQLAVRRDITDVRHEGVGGPPATGRLREQAFMSLPSHPTARPVTQWRATGAVNVHADVTARTTGGPQTMSTIRTADDKQRPYLELRCGGLHLSVQRVPVWLIAMVSTATGTGAAWWSSR